MAKLDLLIQAWDEGYREFGIALEGMPDEDLWKRPHPKLLSVGELAGHTAYWEAIGHIPSEKRIASPLVDIAFRYYTDEVDRPVALNLSVAEVAHEIDRIHQRSKQTMLDLDPETDDLVGGEFFTNWKWGYYLGYRAFHIAYHTGQVYSVRHLLGHATPDN